MSSRPERATRWPARIARLAGLWIMAGALFKLLQGTPNDLPRVVRDAPLELGLTYNLAIAVELCVALLALLRPRWSWVPLVGILLVFEGVLATQIAAGDASCGCFGAKLSFPPWLMVTIDTSLLAAILLSRPWSRLSRKGSPTVIVAGALAIAIALPWFLDRQATDGEVLSGNGTLRNWKELDIEDWVGMDVWDTPLGQPPLSEYLDLGSLPLDGLWVFYRATCEHCAHHLAAMAAKEKGDTLIALIRLKEPTDTEANRVVNEMPSGNFVQQAALPDSLDYVIQTPAEMLLEGGRIVAAREAVTPETGLLPE